ncbi:MAG TPA: methylenetetrahydrofolate reductase, partial [Solirubrobacteraceae bacterium]|nr:methylenetetrahydrofolate reductase [Solirubrobacteraceae bacterium]
MRIDDILAGDGPVFSFEFFPPKTENGERNLENALAELRPLEPAFVSVTYGAGGSTREKTIEIVKRIREQYGLEAMAHFTCVGATVPELRATLDEMQGAGIDNVLALRGDPPAGEEEWVATEGGLEYSRELVELIAGDYPFAIGAACFPETHIHAESPEADLQ